MSNSSLVTVKVPAYSGNFTKNRSNQYFDDGYAKITMITVHHMAGVLTAAQCGTIFQTPGRCGSSHYGIGNDGSVGLYVDESDVAWCNSNWYSNCHAVTIETSNSSIGGVYPVGDTAYNKLVQLVADIAKRNKLGTLVAGQNLTWHSMYAATGCPGDYLRERTEDLARRANAINTKKPVPTTDYLKINGMNRARGEDELIVYNKEGTTTGTNDWGYEVVVDIAGIATSDPVYKGNHTVPKGGMVVSGHGIAGQWIKNKIKKGTSVVSNNGYIYNDPSGYRKLAGTNITRLTNYLVVYKNKASTGTNKWGTEVPCDSNGIMLEKPTQYVGNMAVPKGGSVLSGVNSSTAWMLNCCAPGRRYTVNSLGDVEIQWNQHRTINGINKARYTDDLIVYNKAGTTTGTNQWGTEVAIVNGVAQSDPVQRKGNMAVPTNGWVLSGVNKSEKWIIANIKKGTKVTNVGGNYISIG